MSRLSLILVLLPSLCTCALPFLVQSDESDQFKKLAGPPNEFRNFSNKLNGTSLADPTNILRLPLAYLSVGIEWKYFFPVDPVSSIVVNVAYLKSEMSGKEVIPTLIGPNGDVKLPDQRNVSQNLRGYDADYAVISLVFAAPDPGTWNIVLSVKGRASGEPQRAITWIGFNDTGMEVMAYTASTDNMEYKEVSVNAFLTDQSEEKRGVRGTVDTMENATLTITMPSGDKMMKTMAMDKGKGEMGGTFMPLTPGVYTLDVNVEGEKDGYRFARSSIFQIPVASPSLNVTNGAHIHLFNHPITANEIVLIRVNVLWDSRADSVYRGYAEVYGTGRSGDSVAVAWVGGLVEVKKDNSDYFIQFELDSRWLITSQATFPLTLKNIVFENLSGYVTIVHVKEEVALKVADPSLLSWKPKYTSEEVEISYEMLNGYNPYRNKFLNSTESGTIVLVHGYCATVDPFPISHFTNVRVFRRLRQNLSINQFARLVLEFVNQEQIGLYSIIAHSQGGMVGTHLLEYYQTSMDAMIGGNGRLVQSVGTPYGGTPVAGSLASIGSIFGVGCGSNTDLTVSGANAWRRNIRSSTQRNVFYYTTQYGTTFLNNFCLFGTFLTLSGPNDGVVELERSHLTFGTHVQHSTGECHTDDMHWPSQTRNRNRNSEMNRLAAR